MAFSASESAFEGFRILRREPASVAVWASLQLFVTVVVTALMLPALRDLVGQGGFVPGAATAADPARMAAVANLGRLYLVLLPIYLILLSVYTAAVYRAVLRPADQGLGRLKLSGDELRLAGLWVLMALLFFGVALVAGIVIGIVLAATRGSGAMSALIGVLAYLALLCGWAWVAVRLSLAGPMTFAEKRIRVFGSWRLTQGRFWPLFGCYLLAWVFMILIGIVGLLINAAVSFALGGGSAGLVSMFRPDMSSVQTYFTPAHIVTVFIGAAFGAMIWSIALAAPASAYREIAEPKPEGQAEAFA